MGGTQWAKGGNGPAQRDYQSPGRVNQEGFQGRQLSPTQGASTAGIESPGLQVPVKFDMQPDQGKNQYTQFGSSSSFD